MPKNVQTTIQLGSFHKLASLCLKYFKLGFSTTWTENFQMYKLGLEKAEKLEIKLPTFVGSWKKQRSSKKTSASLTTQKPLTMQIKKQQLELDMEQQTGYKLGKKYVKAVYCHPALFN